MDNLISLMCFGALILFALYAFASMMRLGNRGGMASPYPTAGNESPRFDDPNVQSGGSFGSPFGGSTGLGGAPSASRGATLGESRPRHDDPNVRSGGSFG